MNDDSLHVYYPYGGRRFLLQWYTYDERGHIILASTEKHISEVAARVFAKHPDAEIRSYREVDIVAPSSRLQILAAEKILRDRVANFHCEIIYHMRDVVKAGKELPLPFALCDNYNPEEEADEGTDEWAKETHYSCKNCDETIQLIGMTKEDLYTNYYTDWLTSHPKHIGYNYRNKNCIPSRAEIANDDENLMCARAEFGHHAKGIVLTEIDMSGYLDHCLDGSALFFFRPIRDLDFSSMQEALDASKERAKQFRIRRERTNKETREREERERIDGAVEFFRSRQ